MTVQAGTREKKEMMSLKRVIPSILHITVCLQVLGSTTAYVNKSSMKPSVAPEEAACNLMNFFL